MATDRQIEGDDLFGGSVRRDRAKHPLNSDEFEQSGVVFFALRALRHAPSKAHMVIRGALLQKIGSRISLYPKNTRYWRVLRNKST